MVSRSWTLIGLSLAAVMIIVGLWAIAAESYARLIMQADLAQYLCQLELLPQRPSETAART